MPFGRSKTQLIKFPKCYKTWKFINIFTRSCQWSIPWAGWLDIHYVSLRSILKPYLCLDLPSGLLPIGWYWFIPWNIFHITVIWLYFTFTGVAQLCRLQTCQRPGSLVCRFAWQDIWLSTVKCFEWLPLHLPGENYEIEGKSTNRFFRDWVVKSSTCQILHTLPLEGSWDIGSVSFSPKASQPSHKWYLKV